MIRSLWARSHEVLQHPGLLWPDCDCRAGGAGDNSLIHEVSGPRIDHVLNVEQEHLAAYVADLTGGEGADVVIELSGAPSAIGPAFELSRFQFYAPSLGRLAGLWE